MSTCFCRGGPDCCKIQKYRAEPFGFSVDSALASKPLPLSATQKLILRMQAGIREMTRA